MTEQPRVGTIVDYFDPTITVKVGLIEGYGGRGIGPYAAMVVNDQGAGLALRVYFPGVNPLDKIMVQHKTKVVAHDPNAPPTSGNQNGYWDWQTPPDEPILTLKKPTTLGV